MTETYAGLVCQLDGRYVSDCCGRSAHFRRGTTVHPCTSPDCSHPLAAAWQMVGRIEPELHRRR